MDKGDERDVKEFLMTCFYPVHPVYPLLISSLCSLWLISYANPIAVIIMAIIFIPMNGTTIPPSPYSSKFRRNSDDADIARYLTPRRASGMSAMITSALKMTADSIADSGVLSPIIFNAFKTGKVATNIAGMMAKYLATSLAIEKVVKAPRVI